MTNTLNLDDVIKLTLEFSKHVNSYLVDNKLQPLISYSDLNKKELLGPAYRVDQIRLETLSDFKSNYFGLYSTFEKLKRGDKLTQSRVDSELNYITTQLKRLDAELVSARARIKFYETAIYLIGNTVYGSY